MSESNSVFMGSLNVAGAATLRDQLKEAIAALDHIGSAPPPPQATVGEAAAFAQREARKIREALAGQELPPKGRALPLEPHVWATSDDERLAYRPKLLSERDIAAGAPGPWRCPICVLHYAEWGVCVGSLLEGWHRPVLVALKEPLPDAPAEDAPADA